MLFFAAFLVGLLAGPFRSVRRTFYHCPCGFRTTDPEKFTDHVKGCKEAN